MLSHKTTSYNSVEIDDEVLTDTTLSIEDFKKRLQVSCDQWKAERKFGVFLELTRPMAYLIPAAVSMGFTFHHAKSNYLMLSMWLNEMEESHLPPGPSHFIGVGGMVLKPTGDRSSKEAKDYDILVVQEKSGPSSKFENFWKLPGGLVDAGENISKAIKREIYEETGIDAEFESLGGISEFHNGDRSMARKSSSELYIICCLRLKDESKFKIKIQEKEIKDAKWMNLSDFLNSSIYKNKRDPFAKLTRQTAQVAIGIKSGLEYNKYRSLGTFAARQKL